MSNDAFNEPSLTLSKIYTRTGDEGKTSLVGGQRVSKDDARIAAYGDIDELNSFLGAAICSIPEKLNPLKAELVRVQHELFNLGSQLATLPTDLHPNQPVIRADDVKRLEDSIDAMNANLQPLRSFVLPGGGRLNAELHICRTVCRRAERNLITLTQTTGVSSVALEYVNRLSDFFFVASRHASRVLNQPETLWDPNYHSQM